MASKAVIVAVLLVATVLAAASAAKLPSQFYQYKFEAYMRAFNKQYDEQELGARFAAFQANYDYVEAQNARFAAGESSYELEMNQFADLTREEFAKQRLVRFNSTRARNVVLLPESGLPSSVDWRKKNAVTPVKNQEQCGSNWAFSATGSIEGAWAIAKGKLVSLSEQQLVDCSGSFGNQGCCGGFMDNAFQYIISNGGIDTEADYPYTGVDGTCDTQKQAKHAVSISGFQDVTPNNEAQLQAAVAKVPVSVAFDASSSDMQLYKSGIFDGQCTTNIDHGAVAVGYGTANGKDYWIIKNDWGTSWGVQGYIFLSRGYSGPAGQCGVAILPSYAVVNRADEQQQQQQEQEQKQQPEQPANGPHYEAPPCQSGEVAVQIQGIAGTFCSPKCSSRQPCPTDVPSGTTAKPECVLEMPGHASPTNCALICSPGPNAGCPSGATCQAIQGTGVCTYPKA